MKFPLPADTFPSVDLSIEASAAIQRLAQVVADDTMQQYNAHIHARQGVVDAKVWKPIKKKDEVTVYKERYPSNAQTSANALGTVGSRAAEMPRVLTVGKLQGDLDDVMYNLESHTTDMMRLKGAFKGNGVIDCKNLAVLVKPTRKDPIRSVTLKWQVKGRPLVTRPFVRFRDSLYIESTGIAVSSTGERIGYQLNHSVELPEIRELSDMGIVRANLSFCGLYRQLPHGLVDMFITGFLDPLGDISPGLAVASMAELTVSASRNVLWGQTKKLTWMLSSMPPVKVEKLPQTSSDKCAACSKAFSPVSSIRQCRLCRGRVCSSCRVKKELCLISGESGDVERKSVSLCSRCVHDVATMSALEVAAHEVECEELYPSESASIWGAWPATTASYVQSRDTERSEQWSLESAHCDRHTVNSRTRSSWRC